MTKKILLIALLFSILDCSYDGKAGTDYDEEYNQFKSQFKAGFTDQFPDRLEVITDPKATRTYGYSMNTEKHNVGFHLYEYGVGKAYLHKTESKAKNKAIAQYQATDDCLLVINRFETPDTFAERDPVEISDSSLIDQPCYQGLYPIPHFLQNLHPATQGPVWLNKNFMIYVLEAKPSSTYRDFQMDANPQMPAAWTHGYSKGIAISQRDETVIYWSFLW